MYDNQTNVKSLAAFINREESHMFVLQVSVLQDSTSLSFNDSREEQSRVQQLWQDAIDVLDTAQRLELTYLDTVQQMTQNNQSAHQVRE